MACENCSAALTRLLLLRDFWKDRVPGIDVVWERQSGLDVARALVRQKAIAPFALGWELARLKNQIRRDEARHGGGVGCLTRACVWDPGTPGGGISLAKGRSTERVSCRCCCTRSPTPALSAPPAIASAILVAHKAATAGFSEGVAGTPFAAGNFTNSAFARAKIGCGSNG